jgi:hypothetical protein
LFANGFIFSDQGLTPPIGQSALAQEGDKAVTRKWRILGGLNDHRAAGRDSRIVQTDTQAGDTLEQPRQGLEGVMRLFDLRVFRHAQAA